MALPSPPRVSPRRKEGRSLTLHCVPPASHTNRSACLDPRRKCRGQRYQMHHLATSLLAASRGRPVHCARLPLLLLDNIAHLHQTPVAPSQHGADGAPAGSRDRDPLVVKSSKTFSPWGCRRACEHKGCSASPAPIRQTARESAAPARRGQARKCKACPLSTGGRTRRVQLVRGGGRIFSRENVKQLSGAAQPRWAVGLWLRSQGRVARPYSLAGTASPTWGSGFPGVKSLCERTCSSGVSLSRPPARSRTNSETEGRDVSA